MEYARRVSVTPEDLSVTISVTKPLSVTSEEVSVTQPEQRPFIPNWKRNGFKSKEDAMRYAILLTIDRVPGAVVTYKGKTYDSERVKTTGLKLVPLI